MTDPSQDTAGPGGHTAPVEAWDAIAALYDRHVAPGEAELATAALRLAGLSAGEEFLDVAAGPGGLALPAGRLGARVLATDWSPKMIEHFTARAVAEGLDAEGRVMDCHALDLPDDTYDVTGSLFGVMLVADQAQALREMVRVTKPGGRVLLIAYGNPEQFEALHAFISAAQAVVPGFEGPPGAHHCPHRTAALGLDHRRQPDPRHARRRSHRHAARRHHPGARRDGPRAVRR